MKPLLLAVAAAVILLTGATIWVGARVREPTVVAHPYEEGLAYARLHSPAAAAGGHDHGPPAGERALPAPCELGAGPCALALGELELQLEVGPRPLTTMRELAVDARVRAGGAPVEGAEVELSFEMPGMEMGRNAVRLSPAGEGRYRGSAVLVRCLSGRRDWRATLAVRRGGREARGVFAVTARE